ncbi:MAG: phosphotransferase, partial [Actinocatenispora sp.]
RRGAACGRLHAALARVPAPAAVPPVWSAPARQPTGDGQSTGDRLLHGDLHPFNVLVDDGDEVTGVLDWANAAAGDPLLDRARSWSVLTYDPTAVALCRNPAFGALADGWADAAGFAALPAYARAWACRYMLRDLAHRHGPEQLAPVRTALRAAERDQGPEDPGAGTTPA